MASRNKKPAATFSVSVDESKWKGAACCGGCRKRADACTGGIYFLGFVGAAVYYVSAATGFWNGMLGVLKAVVWPVFLVFDALQFLHL